MCVCPTFPGVKVQWEATAYTYSENIGTVQLVLHKVGFTVSNVSVEVMTVVGNATGMTNQAYESSPDNILCLQCALMDLVLPTAIIHNMYFIFFSAVEDYEADNSTNITFSPAQTSATVSVTIVDDDVLEGVEQFTVEVVATGGQERVDVGGAASIFISDDDCEKTFSFHTLSYYSPSFCVLSLQL